MDSKIGETGQLLPVIDEIDNQNGKIECGLNDNINEKDRKEAEITERGTQRNRDRYRKSERVKNGNRERDRARERDRDRDRDTVRSQARPRSRNQDLCPDHDQNQKIEIILTKKRYMIHAVYQYYLNKNRMQWKTTKQMMN